METTLDRKPVSTVGLKPLTEESMMLEVKQLLGYGGVDKALQLRQVSEILKSLEIEPFDEQKVKDYKKEMLEEKRKRSPARYNAYNDSYSQKIWTWKRIDLTDYQEAIPAFALLRAASVKKALNEAHVEGHFEVHELSHRVKRITADPFMVLVVGDHRFYLDVWNEPKFEGRRTA